MKTSAKNLLLLITAILILSACAAKKLHAGLEGKKWELISVEGNAVTTSTAFMQFNPAEKRVSGKGGCNGFGGTYATTDDKISMTGIISTKMACNNLDTENAFFRVLEKTDRYTIKEDILSLYQGETLLATLKASSL